MSARPKTVTVQRSADVLRHPASVPSITPQRDLAGGVRVLTCGSVDDGKSTLIGRLLWDASDLFDDQRETLRKSTRRVLDGQHLDYSLLVDGLLAEREQGITIDIAWRYFDTAERRFTIIDSPGHAQYTRNMASGATHADVAIMLIDARHGIKQQTKRHAALLDLFGVRRVILAVNKMDLVEWSESRFRAIEADFQSLAQRFTFATSVAIPVAAVTGDNVARQSDAMPWFKGPTLLDALNASKPVNSVTVQAFRFPVQTVLRGERDYRGLAGTVAAGAVSVGDDIIDIVSGAKAKVARIATMDGDLKAAPKGKAVTLVLDRDIDVSRGAILAPATSAPVRATTLDARLVWLSETPYDPRAQYLVRSATDSVRVSALTIKELLDLETMMRWPAESCAVNDIVETRIDLGRAIAADAFSAIAGTGAVLIVDAISGATVAGGVITKAGASAARTTKTVGQFQLTRELLAANLCSDLGDTPVARAEFKRRAGAVAAILREAGVLVDAGDFS